MCQLWRCILSSEQRAITSFTGDYRFLSNFYPCSIVYGGMHFTSLEHAYQASKTLVEEEKKAIQRAKSPGEAKRLGRKVTLNPEFNSDFHRVSVMLDLLYRKFQNPDLREKLLGTGNAELIEGNNWKDMFWGVYNGEGKNHLGRSLMQVRDLIRNQYAPTPYLLRGVLVLLFVIISFQA